MTNTRDDQPPGLTISVYTVDRDTLEHGPSRTRVLPPTGQPMDTAAFPPCECPRCTDRPDR